MNAEWSRDCMASPSHKPVPHTRQCLLTAGLLGHMSCHFKTNHKQSFAYYTLFICLPIKLMREPASSLCELLELKAIFVSHAACEILQLSAPVVSVPRAPHYAGMVLRGASLRGAAAG